MITLQDDVNAFLDYVRAERLNALNTLLAYGRDLDHFVTFADERKGVADYLHPKYPELLNYLEFLRDCQRLAPSTIARHVASLKGFYRWLQFDGRTSRTIVDVLESPRIESRIPHVLSSDDVNKLLDAPQPRDRLYLRDKALLEFLYASGCRASETISLRLSDLHMDEAYCKVTGKGSKQRLIPLGRYAIDALREYLDRGRPRLARNDPTSPWVFVSRGGGVGRALPGKQLSRIMLWIIVTRLARRAGLRGTITPHTLRHCFATHLLDGGADLFTICDLLGHSSVMTTQLYLQVSVEHLKEAHRRFHPRGAAQIAAMMLTDEERHQQMKQAEAKMTTPTTEENGEPGQHGTITGKRVWVARGGAHSKWWTEEELALLGTAPDAVIAAKIGRSVTAVRNMLMRVTRVNAVGVTHGERRDQRWLPEENAIVGTAPDWEVAVRLGRSEESVRKRRKRMFDSC